MAIPRPLRLLVLSLALLPGLLVPASSAGAAQARVGAWEDVPARYWAHRAIDTVAAKRSWMRDYGATHFKPDRLESRKYLGHAMVMAFARNEPVDRRIGFRDLARTDPFYPYANVAVKLKWMTKQNGNFRPDAAVTMTDVHVALVRALGLAKVALGFSHVHTADGYSFPHKAHLGALEVGMLLGLRYNHQTESRDVRPSDHLSRAEVAWSLYRAVVAKTQEPWRITELENGEYSNVTLPTLSRSMRRVVSFGLRYVGYPYIYAGDWYRPTTSGYCCGAQPQGGFDCSGLAWWIVKAPSGGYDNTRIRRYQGWRLPQRSSADMASVGRVIRFKRLRPGDLMFYAGSSGGGVDHVDTYVGNGWALDSSSGIGGVTLLRVDSGWYREHFVHGRRIFPSAG